MKPRRPNYLMSLLMCYRHEDRVAYALTEILGTLGTLGLYIGKGAPGGLHTAFMVLPRVLWMGLVVYPFSRACFDADRFFGT